MIIEESDSSLTSINQRSAANNLNDTDNESEDIIPPKKARGETKMYDYYNGRNLGTKLSNLKFSKCERGLFSYFLKFNPKKIILIVLSDLVALGLPKQLSFNLIIWQIEK
ncbi:hypothetical protein BpHYR1_003420 [Brachionus plicatilis]|uniref:Uncharacterized protein n=1 Tax=Brachionus plicatilis TaxID=10195 RepID=A0A3M7RCR6_BRAPC|nr:hypothetical protein BpHYR1_003420 [Brachionus plicatilis]